MASHRVNMPLLSCFDLSQHHLWVQHCWWDSLGTVCLAYKSRQYACNYDNFYLLQLFSINPVLLHHHRSISFYVKLWTRLTWLLLLLLPLLSIEELLEKSYLRFYLEINYQNSFLFQKVILKKVTLDQLSIKVLQTRKSTFIKLAKWSKVMSNGSYA